MKAVGGLIALLVVLPIWYFLLYRILDAVHANELMWFLYWVYVPAGLLVQGLIKVAERR